ncbi:MAG: hypothetical protein ABR589_00060 [Chthoniobacterales bacterium]
MRGGWILLALVLLLAVVGYFAAGRLFVRFAEGSGLRKHIGAKTAQQLQGEAGYLPLTANGLSFFSRGFVGTAAPPRAVTEIRASNLSARCSLLELWRGKWRIDGLHAEHLQVAFGRIAAEAIRKDEFPMPELEPASSTLSSFKVDIRKTTVDRADLAWGDPKSDGGELRGVHADFTTEGKNLIAQGAGGTFQKGKFPQMKVERFKAFYGKPELRIDEGLLSVGAKSSVAVNGWMRFEQEPSMDLRLKFEACPVAPFLNEAQRDRVQGSFEGTSTIEKKAEPNAAVSARGSVAVLHVVLEHFAALEQAALFTGKSELNPLRLDKASADYDWTPERLQLKDVMLERNKVIAVRGRATIRGESLDATLELGVAPEIVERFPGAREEVFVRSEGGYLWTPVHLTGTMSHPQADVKPRLIAAVERHFAKMLLAPVLKPAKAILDVIEALFQ